MTIKQIEKVSEELGNIALALKYLGTGNAGTSFGAIEAHMMEVANVASAAENIASAAENIALAADNIADSIHALAGAVKGFSKNGG